MLCVKSRWSQSFCTLDSAGAAGPDAGSKEGRGLPPFLNMFAAGELTAARAQGASEWRSSWL